MKGVEAVIIGQALIRERITANSPLVEELDRWKRDMQRSLEDQQQSDEELAVV